MSRASSEMTSYFPLHTKGWNVVSAGTGGTFDPATGAHISFVTFTNDGLEPEFPNPRERYRPPRFIPLGRVTPSCSGR